MEKFFDIKCRTSGLVPDVVVLVATVRSLKMHGGGPEVTAGKPLAEEYQTENLELLRTGCCNMQKHIHNAKKFGIPVIVAINQFSTDTDTEIATVKEMALEAGASDAVSCDHWARGGAGAEILAEAVARTASHGGGNFKYLYDVKLPIEKKIEIIAKEMYGAKGVEFSEAAKAKIDMYRSQVRSYRIYSKRL